jgi:argininosuccinate lyase
MRKGRFNRQVAEVAQRYSESVSFDQRLFRHDIAGSIAHAAALVEARIISGDDFDKIEKGLREIEQEIIAGQFQWDTNRDLHT